jgi:hypothetical protein
MSGLRDGQQASSTTTPRDWLALVALVHDLAEREAGLDRVVISRAILARDATRASHLARRLVILSGAGLAVG